MSMLVEKQVIVNWSRPSEKLPEDGYFVVATVSGTVRNVTYDHAMMIATYYEGEGWCFEELDTKEEMDGMIVHAWCDLEPYGGD